MSEVSFYFDFSSPYGYLAAERMEDFEKRHGVTVVWRPFMIGAAFKQTGQSPLLDQPIRGPYFRHDMERCARLQNIPFQIPNNFPYAALVPTRAYYWLESRSPMLARKFAKDIYRGYFADGLDMSNPENVFAAATRHSINASEMRAAVESQKWKDHVRAVTEDAIKMGAFGSPFFFYEDEPFFGNDRIDQLAQWISLRKLALGSTTDNPGQ
ncbi:MAG: 2-hydroxychromene-2-carboxylate isomerase [Thalassospira sp.]|uniref:2-hydroxychromene-2-carboxylate isomerase n=1 Tax=Thalassospira sp. TaxID=1912094 RepID=UPI001B0CC6F7|nr:2-hydroxychromene-2-carboxylate isomerase [Thalassospira sp.]MBO6581047.1 2-hydroxychromene-2-carboxylate isomerase [Thalassospira sp.]MBO6819184.1 2-hydroxychromene-2-carboxylate isomerase [Thalassospira sp.]MBO6889988.1 2-hydroxychromene-2-carboxylate isomerase [Thalassospira sp.]